MGSHKAWFIRTVPVSIAGEIVSVHESTAIAEIRESSTVEEQEANARLIASAPALYAALEDVLGMIEQSGSILRESNTFRSAIAALSLARGEKGGEVK